MRRSGLLAAKGAAKGAAGAARQLHDCRATICLLSALTLSGCQKAQSPEQMHFERAEATVSDRPPSFSLLASANLLKAEAQLDDELASLSGAHAFFLGAAPERTYVVEVAPQAPEAPETPKTSAPKDNVGSNDSEEKVPLVLVHGLGTAGMRDFYPVLSELAASRRVLLIDLPGLARSELNGHTPSPPYLAARVHQVIASQIEGPFDLLGHSLGGNVCLTLAGHPDVHPRKLILVDAAGVLHKDVFVEAQVGGSIAPLREWNTVLGGAAEGFSRRLVETTSPFSPQDDTLQKGVSLSSKIQAEAAVALILHQTAPYTQNVQSPTLLLWGQKDHIAPLRTGLLLSDRLFNAELQVFPQAGHVPMHDVPNEFVRAAVAFLDAPVEAGVRVAVPEAGVRVAAAEAGVRVAVPELGSDQGKHLAAHEELIHCHGDRGPHITGSHQRLTLVECDEAEIENATIGRIVLRDTQVQITKSAITDGILAYDSDLWITGGSIEGAVALYLQDSQADIAGTIITGSHAAIASKDGARLLLSASFLYSPYSRGVVHEQVDLKKRQAL